MYKLVTKFFWGIIFFNTYISYILDHLISLNNEDLNTYIVFINVMNVRNIIISTELPLKICSLKYKS